MTASRTTVRPPSPLKRSPGILFISLYLLAAILMTTRTASATLGETADSIATDRKAISGAKSSATAGNDYSVQEIISDSATIREYISPTGVVFAVAWNGLTNPDLTPLLGSFAGEY